MTGQCVVVPPLSRKTIRREADAIRESIGWTKPYFPIVGYLEHVLPRLLDDFALDVMEIPDLGADHARTYPSERLIQVRLDVYEGACRGKGRDRLTLAHELGHLVLHQRIALTRSVRDDSIPAYSSSEWQASCFGGELLMPADHVRSCGSVREIATTCVVSVDAATTQRRAVMKERR